MANMALYCNKLVNYNAEVHVTVHEAGRSRLGYYVRAYY